MTTLDIVRWRTIFISISSLNTLEAVAMAVSPRARLLLFSFNSEMNGKCNHTRLFHNDFVPFTISIFSKQKSALSKRCVDIDSSKLNLKCSCYALTVDCRYLCEIHIEKPVYFTYAALLLPVKMLWHSSFAINHS